MDLRDWLLAGTGILIGCISLIRKGSKPSEAREPEGKPIWFSGINFNDKEEEEHGKRTAAGRHL